MKIKISNLYIIPKAKLVNLFFFTAMLLAIFSSLSVWFLLPLGTFTPIIIGILLICAMLISRTMDKPLFSNKHTILPVISYFTLICYQAIVNNNNINTYIIGIFNTYIIFALYKYDHNSLFKLSTILAKVMGGFLALSIPLFFLYLSGFPLPYRDMSFNDGFYYFSNYYFFLIDERTLFSFFPRFQSVFPEPAFLGGLSALLLFAQRGYWKKWYNIMLIIGLLLSFSLGGYVYFITITFLIMWIKRKKIIKNILIVTFIIATIVCGSFFYNDGDNLLHDLIILRLEIEDGELTGNNRTTKGFNADFQKFLQSDDILLGKDFDYSIAGNAGYKVFIYDFGVVGTFLLFLFYTLAFIYTKDKRSMISAWIVVLLIWGVDGFVLWFGRFIPIYLAVYNEKMLSKLELKN